MQSFIFGSRSLTSLVARRAWAPWVVVVSCASASRQKKKKALNILAGCMRVICMYMHLQIGMYLNGLHTRTMHTEATLLHLEATYAQRFAIWVSQKHTRTPGFGVALAGCWPSRCTGLRQRLSSRWAVVAVVASATRYSHVARPSSPRASWLYKTYTLRVASHDLASKITSWRVQMF